MGSLATPASTTSRLCAAVDAIAADLKSKASVTNKFNGACATGYFTPTLLGRRSPIIIATIADHARAGKRLPVVLPEDLVPDGTAIPLNKKENAS